MTLSICFIIVDICSVTDAFNNILPDGLNPFWKMAMVFKCLTDSIILDDFKTALDKLMQFKMHKEHLDTITRPSDSMTTSAASYSNKKPQDPFGEDAIDTGRANERRKASAAQSDEVDGKSITFEEMVNGPPQAHAGATEAVNGPVEHYEDMPDMKMF